MLTPSDLAGYIGAETVDEGRAALLLELAREACEEIARPLPESARGVVLDVAATAYASAPGPGGQQTAGPFSAPVAPGGITLSPRHERRLRRIASGGPVAFSARTG